MRFVNRVDAGCHLAAAVQKRDLHDPVVVGLPRGGVPVAYQVAQALHAPLDVIVVRKLGLPYQPELGVGAIGEDGVRVVNEELVRATRLRPDELETIERRERAELRRRARRLRGDRAAAALTGRTVVVVDDGVATGSTARAACRIARARGAARVVLAVPVGPPGVREQFRDVADEVICLHTPPDFVAVGQCYGDFAQTTDEQVVELLRCAARADPRTAPAPADPPGQDEEVGVTAGGVRLAGHLAVPDGAPGVVVFAHGSGSSRHSPRNRYVASRLNAAGLGILLFDLLTPAEERDRGNVFDIDLLADRLAEVTAWLRARPGTERAAVGYFGASTGAAAALTEAAAPDADIAAVVSRGGRPDLASLCLGDVRAPTLLIVGGSDDVVLQLNRAAQRRLRCENRLETVPGATHLFEEPGALETVAALAEDWFVTHFAAG